MINQIHDNSAVENYLKELSAREAEKTQSYRVQNFVKEAPYKVFRTGGVILAVAILLYFLGLGIGNARSFEVVTINENIETRNGYDQAKQEAQNSSEDQLIDVEEILSNQVNVIPSSLEENITNTKSVVRNYYIFDDIPFNGKVISVITVGRKFSAPDSPPVLEWCYISVYGQDGLSKRIDLVELQSGKRRETKITRAIAKNLNISVEELKGAQSACVF